MWLPERWTFIDSVPKTSVGKFDKKVLRAQYAEDALEGRDRQLMESFEDLANDVAALERRVADVIFDAVRAQLRSDDAESPKNSNDTCRRFDAVSKKPNTSYAVKIENPTTEVRQRAYADQLLTMSITWRRPT